MSLTQAWAKVRSNSGAAGGDGVTRREFSREAGLKLERLSLELRAGLYRPGAVRRVNIPKKRGGVRTLSIPCIIDRIAQSAMANALTPTLEAEFEPSSFAYRPGRGVKQAIRRVESLRRDGFRWTVEADIKAFFDEIPHDPLLKRLFDVTNERALVALVGLWLDGFSDDGRGVAQGSPISPMLANLHLDIVDEALTGRNIRLVRYADDFVILARSEGSASKAMDMAEEQLGNVGLELNRDKTRITPFEESVTFLGKMFVRSIVTDLPDDDVIPQGTTLGEQWVSVADTVSEKGVEDWENSRSHDGAAILRPLYVVKPGRRLETDKQCFVVNEDGEDLIVLNARRIGRIEVGPQVDVSDEAIRLALASDIPISFIDGHGGLIGQLGNSVSQDADKHLSQAAAVLDPTRRLELARLIVRGRLESQRQFLKRTGRRNRTLNEQLADPVLKIDRAAGAVSQCRDISELMGREGQGTAMFWKGFDLCLKHDWRLKTRARRIGADPVNLVLDWLASLLHREIKALVSASRLHPGFGVLHAVDNGRDSLALDIIELFRAPIVESLALYLFNNRILSREHFAEGTQGVSIEPEGGARLIREWEKRLEKEVRSSRTGHRHSWRALIREEIQSFGDAMTDGSDYVPYLIDY